MVIDASALLEVLKQSATGLELAPLLLRTQLHAPHLIDLEVVQALRRLTFRGEMTLQEAEAALELFRQMRITRHPVTPLVSYIWSLRHNLTAYDASYLALARVLDAELLTMDQALRNLAQS